MYCGVLGVVAVRGNCKEGGGGDKFLLRGGSEGCEGGLLVMFGVFVGRRMGFMGTVGVGF
jgi:hypothetical protein